MLVSLKNINSSLRIRFILIILLILVQGCSVKLISTYDEKTDTAVSNLQKKVESFFLTLETQEGLPDCNYENHPQFYKEAKVDISSMDVRARAIPDNEITIQQIGLLKDNLELLEELHKTGCLSKEQIKPLRINFNSGFTAILKLELAKKRGE